MKLLTLRKLHKWVSLVVGLQLVLWSASGLMFAWLDHHQVSGENLIASHAPELLPVEEFLSEPAAWIDEYADRNVHEIHLQPVGDRWVYRIAHAEGAELRLAADGRPHALDAATAGVLARRYYAGKGPLREVTFLPAPTLETRKLGATWRADFADDNGTSVYVAADSGALAALRTDTWRVFDFFWMLHTMDYVGRDNFNNPVVILVGTAGLWIALTGLLLVFRVFKRSDFVRQAPRARTAAR